MEFALSDRPPPRSKSTKPFLVGCLVLALLVFRFLHGPREPRARDWHDVYVYYVDRAGHPYHVEDVWYGVESADPSPFCRYAYLVFPAFDFDNEWHYHPPVQVDRHGRRFVRLPGRFEDNGCRPRHSGLRMRASLISEDLVTDCSLVLSDPPFRMWCSDTGMTPVTVGYVAPGATEFRDPYGGSPNPDHRARSEGVPRVPSANPGPLLRVGSQEEFLILFTDHY
ncbi:MAG: hypothetical protein U0230_27970 [Polyangiales bacterium]